ncbi:MAG: HAD family hydrolase [Candidatus Komeilibacteria bacterium]|nr:HAD family hydrolase [Candidatus Komeilibacteria bacterium]
MKNIIFDWSGTLSDDVKIGYEATMAVMQQLIGRQTSFEEFKREFTLPYMDYWYKYAPHADKKQCDDLFYQAIQHSAKPLPFNGSNEVLAKLMSAGTQMAVLSSYLHEKLVQDVADYGFTPYFRLIKGSVHDKRKVIEALVKENGFDPQETAFVGDMVHDIETGKTAGIKTVAVTWGVTDKLALAKGNPDYIIDDIFELLKI